MALEVDCIRSLLKEKFICSLDVSGEEKQKMHENEKLFATFNFEKEECSASEIAELIKDKNAYLPSRLSALFSAKELGGTELIKALIAALKDNSVLLRHEIAYVLGQMRSPEAIDVLTNLLKDTNENEMVRHEAAEALGAIGDPSSIEILNDHLSNETSIAVKETCVLAKLSLEKKNKAKEKEDMQEQEAKESKKEIKSVYKTLDPFDSLRELTEDNQIYQISDTLFNEAAPIQCRYEALFTLRNINDDFAVDNVNRVLLEDSQSVLFRHEVSFVLGQMQKISSIPFLIKCLNNKKEHCMVRHEAALSLGSITVHAIFISKKKEETMAGQGEIVQENVINEALIALKNNLDDPDKVVSESCLVALQNIIDECNLKHF